MEFTAIVTNGSGNLSYQWRLNGVNVGSNSSAYNNADLDQNDQIAVIVT